MTKNYRVIIAALIILGLAVGSAVSCTSNSPWTFQTVEGEASLLSISAADRSHVWAVGGGPVYFFNGVSWATQAEKLEKEPLDVCAVDATRAYAGGGDGGGVVFAFDGGAWTKLLETQDDTINVVAAADSAHLWAIGTNESGVNIYFYDGSAWVVQYRAELHFQDMFALDPAHVWGVAESRNGKSAVYFFDGASWSKIFEPAGGELLLGVTACAPDRAWAVGSSPERSGGAAHAGGSIFFFDGSSWSKQYDTKEELHRATAVDPEHVWATGGIGEAGPIYFFDGSYWRKQFDGNEPLFDISAADAKAAWAVGGLGSIYTLDEDKL